MTQYDFDAPVERRSTNSIKWSAGEVDGKWVTMPAAPGPAHESALLPMWLADMDFTAAPEILAALQARVDHGVFGYTYYDESFYAAIEDWMATRRGWRPQREWILTNSGVMPAINLLIQTFTEPGDGVIVQPPVFRPISDAPEANGRLPVVNPLTEVDGRYRIDFAALESQAADPGTTMMILCSPHNPVGRVWTSREVKSVAEICAGNDVVLVSDEIHADLTYSWAAFTSVGSLYSEVYDRFIVCGGPSKAFNLPGLKLSLTFVPNPKLREAYRETLHRQNELWAANTLGATALTAAYESGGPWLDAVLEYLEANVALAERFLAARVPGVTLARPDALYLLWLDCRRLRISPEELNRRLRAAGLWLESGESYGDQGSGFVRMTAACPRGTLQEGLRRLEAAVT